MRMVQIKIEYYLDDESTTAEQEFNAWAKGNVDMSDIVGGDWNTDSVHVMVTEQDGLVCISDFNWQGKEEI